MTDSSEAILLGRKPPFRLLVRLVVPGPGAAAAAAATGSGTGSGGGSAPGSAAGAASGSKGGAVGGKNMLPAFPVRHAISEGYVVTTRRTRTAGKVDIPSVDDHVRWGDP